MIDVVDFVNLLGDLGKDGAVESNVILFPPGFFAGDITVPISGLDQYEVSGLYLIINTPVLKFSGSMSYVN